MFKAVGMREGGVLAADASPPGAAVETVGSIRPDALQVLPSGVHRSEGRVVVGSFL